MSKPRLWQRGRSSYRRHINFRLRQRFPDAFSVGRERSWAARPKVLR